MFCHTKYMGERIIQFVWKRPKAPPTSHTKYMGTSPGAGGKRTGSVGHLRRHGFLREVCEGACRVGWPVVAVQVGNSHVYLSPAAPPCIQYERGENTH